jgi:hypothetical protein
MNSEYIEPNKTLIPSMIKFIKHNVGDLSINERQDILQMLVNSPINDKKIQTKGDGTQIKFNDIHKSVIIMIYNYIYTKLNTKKDELQYFPDKEEHI